MSAVLKSTPVLDELSHRYHLDGKPLESVTRIIKSVWPNRPTFEGAPIHVLEHARHRGERVDHWVCEYARLNGDVDVEDDDDVIESVKFFDRWWNKVQPIYIDHQRMVWDEAIGVCGKLDLLLRIEDRPMILDVKRTHNEEETWPLQVGAYRDLYHHMPSGDQFHVSDVAVLHIHPRFKHGFIQRNYDTNEVVQGWRNTVAFWQTVRSISGK